MTIPKRYQSSHFVHDKGLKTFSEIIFKWIESIHSEHMRFFARKMNKYEICSVKACVLIVYYIQQRMRSVFFFCFVAFVGTVAVVVAVCSFISFCILFSFIFLSFSLPAIKRCAIELFWLMCGCRCTSKCLCVNHCWAHVGKCMYFCWLYIECCRWCRFWYCRYLWRCHCRPRRCRYRRCYCLYYIQIEQPTNQSCLIILIADRSLLLTDEMIYLVHLICVNDDQCTKNIYIRSIYANYIKWKPNKLPFGVQILYFLSFSLSSRIKEKKEIGILPQNESMRYSHGTSLSFIRNQPVY